MPARQPLSEDAGPVTQDLASSLAHRADASLPPRRPPGTATSAVSGDRTGMVLRSKQKNRRNQSYAADYKPLFSPALISSEVRNEIETQFFRLLGKRDPRAIPRIIHDRVGVPVEVATFVIHGLVRQYRDWTIEIRQAIARADESSAAMWKRKKSA